MLNKHTPTTSNLVSGQTIKRNTDMKQFYFSMISKEEVGNEAWFMLVEKDFYDNLGHLDDNHIQDLVLANITNPSEFKQEFAEECESMFQALQMNRKETLAYLKAQPNFIKKRL